MLILHYLVLFEPNFFVFIEDYVVVIFLMYLVYFTLCVRKLNYSGGVETHRAHWEVPEASPIRQMSQNVSSSDIRLQTAVCLFFPKMQVNICITLCLLYVPKELLSERDMENLLQVTGCSAELQQPSCDSDCLSERYRSLTGECNNRFVRTEQCCLE